jgi:hypothetical protein
VARAASRHSARERRHRALNRIGPLLLPALLAALMLLFITGFALLYLPWMPDGFQVDEGAADAPRWLQALYFSGVTLTTLGYGDIVPATMPVRLLALIEAATGFVAIPLTVTYFLTVAGALERRRAAALGLFHEAGRGPDAAAALLAHHHLDGRFIGLETSLMQATRDLQGVLESHVEHPVIHFFHPVEVHDGLPRMLFIALEVAAVARALLDPQQHREACAHPALGSLETTARHALRELAISLQVQASDMANDEVPENALEERELGDDDQTARRQRRFERTRARLAEAGIALRPDMAAAQRDYLRRRLAWERDLGALAAFLGYDWDEVTGDRDPTAAADADHVREEA